MRIGTEAYHGLACPGLYAGLDPGDLLKNEDVLIPDEIPRFTRNDDYVGILIPDEVSRLRSVYNGSPLEMTANSNEDPGIKGRRILFDYLGVHRTQGSCTPAQLRRIMFA